MNMDENDAPYDYGVEDAVYDALCGHLGYMSVIGNSDGGAEVVFDGLFAMRRGHGMTRVMCSCGKSFGGFDTGGFMRHLAESVASSVNRATPKPDGDGDGR